MTPYCELCGLSHDGPCPPRPVSIVAPDDNRRISCTLDDEGFAQCTAQNADCRFYKRAVRSFTRSCYYAIGMKCCHACAVSGKVAEVNMNRRKTNGRA
jgi:hypothetical protein